MERRFRRQESASSSIDSGGLLRREMLGSSTNKSRHNSQVFAVNKEWQEYIAAVEGDHTELQQLYKAQTDELSSLRSLLAEQPIRDALTHSLVSRVSEYEACLKELLVVLTSTEKLCERNAQDANKGDMKNQGSSKKCTKDSASQLSVVLSNPVMLMDAVRDAAMKQQQCILNYQNTTEKNQVQLQEMERKLASMKCKCTTKGNNEESYTVPAGGIVCDCFVPSSSRELAELRTCILDLKQQLRKSKMNERNIMAELRSTKHNAEVSSQSSQRYAEQLDGLRALLNQKERLLTDVETRYHAAEERLRKQQQTGLGSTRTSDVNDKVNARFNDTDDKLETTHHHQLLVGKEVVLAFMYAPEEFNEVFLGATSAALQLPRSRVSIIKTQLIGDRHGVSIELVVQHSASMREGAIDSLIHRYPYRELEGLKEHALVRQLEEAETTAHEGKAALLAKVQQLETLQKRVDGLQRLLVQRNRDQESTDRHVDVALEEAEVTVKDVYAALEAERLETENANAALKKAQEEAAVQLQKLDNSEEQLKGAQKIIESMESQLKAVEGQLLTAEKQKMELEQSLRALRLRKNEQTCEATDTATMGSVVETFALRFPLPLSVASEVDAATLFSSASASGSHASGKSSIVVATLYRLLLCEASMATGAVPVRISRASMISNKLSPTQAPTLDLKLELACFETAGDREAVCQNIAKKLSSCPFHYSLLYLQEHIEVSRQLARPAQGSNPMYNAKTLEKAIQAPTSSLQELINTLETQFDGVLTAEDRRAAEGVEGKAKLLIERLGTLEIELRQTRADAKENEKKLIEEGNAALEQLRVELQSAPQRCEELQRQLLEMETDMNDFVKIQASLQDSLEDAQTELRAKKQDHEYLKHYIRQIEKESERVKENNRRLCVCALAADSVNESGGAKKRSCGSGSSKASEPAETKSVIEALHNTRSLLQDIMRKVQKRGSQATAVTEPAAAADLSKASVENYMLVRQLHSAITTLLSEHKSPSEKRSECVGDGAAASSKRTPAAAPTLTEGLKQPKKSTLKHRVSSTVKGSVLSPSNPTEESRGKVGRAVRPTPAMGAGVAFSRSATAACARPRLLRSPAVGLTPSDGDEPSLRRQSGRLSPSPAAGDRGGKDDGWRQSDGLTEAMVLTREHRFVSPVSRPPPLGLGPSGEAALSQWILPAFSTSRGFQRSHTTNDHLGVLTNVGNGKQRSEGGDAGKVLYERTLSGHRRL